MIGQGLEERGPGVADGVVWPGAHKAEEVAAVLVK